VSCFLQLFIIALCGDKIGTRRLNLFRTDVCPRAHHAPRIAPKSTD
jgi:hypothetical protein